MPKDYGNPIAKKEKGFMREHRYIMERYLAEHPELAISQKFLIDGKYLKSECVVHHINFDKLDNNLENLWLCESVREHKLIERSLFKLVEELLRSKLIVFRKGKYTLNY